MSEENSEQKEEKKQEMTPEGCLKLMGNFVVGIVLFIISVNICWIGFAIFLGLLQGC